MERRKFLQLSGAAALAAGASVSAPSVIRAATGPMRLIIAGPGGSRSGYAGRILAGALQRELGRSVEALSVDSPREGYMMLAAAPPDGATIGLIGADMPALHRGLGGSPGVAAVEPVALISEDPAGIHVRRDAPWRSASELTAALRSGRAQPRASGSGRLAVWHLSAERWRMAARAGSTLHWSAAPSAAEAAETLVMAGGPDIVICSIPEVRATPAARYIRTLAVMSPHRNPRYPDVASSAESGAVLRAGWWRGVAAPRGTRASDIATLEAALRRVHASAGWRGDMVRRGFALSWGDRATFARMVAAEDRAMANTIRALA